MMRLGYCILIIALLAPGFASAQSGLGGLTNTLQHSNFVFRLETRLGYITCDFIPTPDGEGEQLLGCTYPDGSPVTDDHLERLGLIEE